MQLVFVHGWSVTSTSTYGGLPEALAAAAAAGGLDLDIRHIHLGRYVSFHDEVTVDDIARAMDRALRELPGNGADHIAPFSCITHSTGGPVVRYWVDRFYGDEDLKDLPLTHLVMLAPANHGSALAVLGKGRVGRIQAWFNGVEPGQRVLDWLCLGSAGQWRLNERYLSYDYAARGFYPFVLTGQGIDRRFYDFLNNYLVEPGSDGVVRVAGANMNYCYLSLLQNPRRRLRDRPPTFELEEVGGERTPQPVPLGVYAGTSHSGPRMGIMGSVRPDDTQAPVVQDVVRCLQVQDPAGYRARGEALAAQTAAQQQGADRYCMLIVGVQDDRGQALGENDYDLLLLGGKGYRPQQLPPGFFQDKQMNRRTGRLVYYVDADKMAAIRDGCFGLRVVARPSAGFSYYCAAEFRIEDVAASDVLRPNQATYVEITLHRFVDENVFRFGPAGAGPQDFKRIRPSGNPLE